MKEYKAYYIKVLENSWNKCSSEGWCILAGSTFYIIGKNKIHALEKFFTEHITDKNFENYLRNNFYGKNNIKIIKIYKYKSRHIC